MDKRDNSGVLFANDKKDNDRAPNYKGNIDRKSTRLNSSHSQQSRMPSSA